MYDVIHGGKEIRDALIRMRQQPLEEIKKLDSDFDGIRADLTAASNAIKNHSPSAAAQGISTAITKLRKFSTPEIEMASKAVEKEYQTSLVTPQRLQALLQTVRDSLGTSQSLPPFKLIGVVFILAHLLLIKPVFNFYQGVLMITKCTRWRAATSILLPIILFTFLVVYMFG